MGNSVQNEFLPWYWSIDTILPRNDKHTIVGNHSHKLLNYFNLCHVQVPAQGRRGSPNTSFSQNSRQFGWEGNSRIQSKQQVIVLEMPTSSHSCETMAFLCPWMQLGHHVFAPVVGLYVKTKVITWSSPGRVHVCVHMLIRYQHGLDDVNYR